MLLSELQERERRFKLALRAGIPILLLVSLVFYTLFIQEGTFRPTIINGFLIAGIIFITVYFNYFLIEMSVREKVLDDTTHSFNEKSFIAALQRYKAKTLILFTVNNLYAINDNYSTEKVDLLLYTIIHKLNTFLKQSGIKNPLIGRRYGAEFLIAINEENHDVNSILETFIDEHKLLNEIEIDYAFSAVIKTEDNIEQVLGHLKDLLSSNIGDKKNANIIQNADELSQIEQEIIDALNHKRFELDFRPLENIKTNQIDIYMITSKLLSDTQKKILPKTYIPIINRLSMGINYDLTLSEHIIKILPLMDDSVSFSFNLSPFSLRNTAFQEKFFKLLDTYNIDPSRLIIQLHERKAHHNLSGYLKTLTVFRDKGIRICIDNFGSSSTSIDYMKHFKFDMLRFSQDYVTNLKDTTSLAMLSSLITMSKDLHILTVAKWVDTKDQKNTLKSLGINYVQGFEIGNAVSKQEIIDRYK